MISVIIPTYNRENTIKRAVLSVLKQTYTDIEVIVVDDCSNDDTEKIVKTIKDKRLKYLRLERNSGACAARNYGIIHARGDFIAFQDSDDEWDETKLATQLEYLKRKKADVVFCGFDIYEGGKFIKHVPRFIRRDTKITYEDLLSNPVVSTQTLLGKNICFKSVMFDVEMPRFQDWDISLRLARKFSIFFQNKTLVKLNTQSDSISKNMEKGASGLEKIFEKNEATIKKCPKALANYYIMKSEFVLDREVAKNLLRKASDVDKSLVNKLRILKRVKGLKNMEHYQEDLCIVIMAGGKGSRFWPKSTTKRPKQFLALVDKKTMLQLTVERARRIVPLERIFIVAGEMYKELIMEQIKDLPSKNIIVEPEGRNTAPCIGLACNYVKQLWGSCNIAVLPSDHLVNDDASFKEKIIYTNNFLNLNKKIGIVTMGIVPSRPEIGYGYIKIAKDIGALNGSEILPVEEFVEKPDKETAKKYLAINKYLWNAGIFLFNVEYMLDELNKHANSIYQIIKKLPKITSSKYEKVLFERYRECESISIDYAVIEKSKNVYVSLANFEWDDIGTWESLYRYLNKDENGNILNGKVECEDVHNSLAYGGKKRLILIDVDDICVIGGPDDIVVCKKERINEIRKYRNEK